MKRPAILLSSLVSISILYVLHLLGDTFYFYWTYWWYDVVAHFWAGISGGLASYWVLFESGVVRRRVSLAVASLAIFLCVMSAGVAWEIFEYRFNLVGSPQEGYARDTANDLILDGMGALLAVALSYKKKYG